MFDFITFFKPQISAVPVDDLVVLPQQLCRYCYIVDIGGGGFHRMDKTVARIHASVALHTEIPLISLLRLVLLRVSFLFRILGRAGCADECGVHDATAPHHLTRTFQTAVDCIEKQFAIPFLLQQIPEV